MPVSYKGPHTNAAVNKKDSAFQEKKAVLSALEEENRKAIQSRRPAASATNYKGPGVISSLPPKDHSHAATSKLESIAENSRTTGKPGAGASTNPFVASSRPISQMLPKRTTDH